MAKRSNYNKGDLIGSCVFIESLGIKTYGNSKKQMGLFTCSCGKNFEAIISQVKNGNTKSCGCLNILKIKEQGFKNSIHGQRKHPLYKMWQGMLRRCKNPKDFAYHNYGGRGIKSCDRWKDINNFLEDMYSSYQPGLELDRINVNGDYEPENCRWVTRKQNMNNMRRNRIVEYNGISKTVSEWSDELDIHYKTLLARLNKWNVEKSFTYKSLTNNG